MTRVDNMKRVARVLCTVAGSGGSYTEEQLFSLESTFVARKFTPTLIDSVHRMVKDAALLRQEDMTLEIQKILRGNKFSKKEQHDLVLDMLRVAAVTNFFREQCDTIYAVAKELGYDETEMQGIVELIESERESMMIEDANHKSDDEIQIRSTPVTPKAA